MFAERISLGARSGALSTHLRQNWYKWTFVFVLGWLTIYPLAMLLLTSFRAESAGSFTLNHYVRAFSDPSVYRLVWTTVWLALVRCVFATIVGVFLAWVVTRTDTPRRGLMETCIWITFFVPTIPMTIGWTLLASRTGLVNTLLQQLPFVNGPLVNVYSYWGIVFVSTLHMSAFIFLLTAPVLRSMDATLEESARVSGAGRFRTLMRVTFPLALPAILDAAFYMFVFALESFETELLLGTPARIYVFSTQIYLLANAFPTDLPKATALSVVFVAIIVGLIFLRIVLLRGKHFTAITGRGYTPRPSSLGKWRWLTFSFCVVYLLLAAALPLAMLVLGSFVRVWGVWGDDVFTLSHWQVSLNDPRLMQAVLNTLQVGVLVGLGVVLICSVATYIMVRTQFSGRRLLEFITWAPRMAPAPVLAIAFIQAYVGGTPIFRPVLGTVLMLAIVLTVNFVPLGTRTLGGAMHQVAYDLEETARVSGASWATTFRKIMLPLLAPALVTAFVLSFLLAIRNLTLVIFFYTGRSRVLSTMLWEEWTGSYTGRALAIGLVMIAMAGVALAVALLLRRRFGMSMSPR